MLIVLAMTKKNYCRKVIDMESYAKDGRLTEPSDGVKFEWRKMIEEVKRLGRPLTDEESEKYRIK